MIQLARTFAVFRFEWSRALTVPRMAWWLVLAVFPPGLVTLVRFLEGDPPDPPGAAAWTFLLFVLIPCVVCLMGLLLWATPWLQSELEGKTWTYLAVRPGGKTAMLVGKYLTAVSWTALAGWMALALSLIVISPPDLVRNAAALGALVLLACLAYGAVFVLLGVIVPKRAMVSAVVYTLVVEFLVGLIPAVVNELTVQYRLRALLVKWMDWEQTLLRDLPEFFRLVLDSGPAWQQVLILLGIAGGLVTLSAVIVRQRELTVTGDE